MKLGFVSEAAPTLGMKAGTHINVDGLIGVGIAAIAPAAFWTGLAYWIFAAIGAPLSLSTVALIATAIAGFLALIYRALATASA